MMIATAAVLAVLLLVAAVGDLRTREIPNMLNGVIALAAPIVWWQAGLSLWPDIAWQVAVALIVFALFAGLFFAGVMGGGDVKMLGAMALWISPALVLSFLLLMSLLGGLLAAVMLVRRRLGRGPEVPEVPYGVAIAAAGWWVLYEQFVNQFPLIPTR